MPIMILSIVQTNPSFGDIRSNVDDALALMRSVKADLFVLPELFNTGYNFVTMDEVIKLSEDDSGYTMQAMLDFAKTNNCYCVFGYAEQARSDGQWMVGGERWAVGSEAITDKERETENRQPSTVNRQLQTTNYKQQTGYYNSSALVGPDGIIGKYRKIHLYYRENLFFTPGDLGFPVFDLPFGKVGMMICYDWIYPESARSLMLNGAQLIAHPANLVLPYCPDAMITRCLENRVFAATANRVGFENRGGVNLTYIGTSQVVSNKGRILTRCCDDKSEISVVEVDLMQACNKQLNEFNDLLNDRRPEQYQWL